MMMLAPLAFFWDIENCQVPVNKSAFGVVQRLRQRFGCNLAEVEFIVVCDVNKERPDVVEDLNAAQITVIHVKSLAKNACDDKLRTSMTKFGMCYRRPGVVILISSDVNFAPSLTDLRYRCGFHVVLLHNDQISSALLMTANEHFDWQTEVLAAVPDRLAPVMPCTTARAYKIFVSNLPDWTDEHRIRDRLKQLCDNCGGRVVEIDLITKTAKIGFCTPESAMRAQKRMNGADVFGKCISVCLAKGGVKRQPSNTNVVGTTSAVAPPAAPELHHSSTAPASFTYIGRSRIAHHFSSMQPPGDVAERSAVDTIPEGRESIEVDVAAVAAAIAQLVGPGQEEGSSQGDVVEIPSATGSDMNLMRNHDAETERLKRTLGFGNHDRVVWTGGAEIDDGLDFTPVKMIEEAKHNEGVHPGRRSRNESSSVHVPSTGERPLHSPSSKMRLLERFAREAVELLRGSPQCQILLQRFASTWCSHFNRPLRLAEFGCSKLAELLTEVGDTLQIVERPQKEKWITLAPALLKTSLQDQIVSVLRQQPNHQAPVDRLLEFYQSTFGYALDLRLFGFNSIDEILANMREVTEIETAEDGTRMVTLLEFRHRQMLANQLLYMFIRCPERRLASWQLENEFRSEFGIDVSLADVKKFLNDLVQITEYDAETIYIELNQIQRLALRLRRILVLNGGELPLTELEQIYHNHYGERILLADDCGGNKSVLGVLRSASHVLYLKGRGATNCSVCINRNFLSSLKNLKPDLFIPPEVPKMKKRGHGHPRSLSSSGNCTFEKVPKPYGGNQADVVILKKSERPLKEVTNHDAKSESTEEKQQQQQTAKPSSPLLVDDVSAASTPPETNGFDKEKRAQVPEATSAAAVLIAGSGALPKNQLSIPSFSSSSLCRMPVTKSMAKTQVESQGHVEPASAVVHSPSRRCRLAANFGALPKNE